MQQDVTIIRATASSDLLEAGITAEQPFYLAWDQRDCRLYVVQWERLHWGCSCLKPRCAHRMAANTYLLDQCQRSND